MSTPKSAPNLKLEVIDVFQPFLVPARYKAAFGGRGSGKSHFFASIVVAESARQAGRRTICVREVQKSLKDSAKRLIEDKIVAFGLERHFQVKHDSIITPGGGIIAFQGMQDHTAESVKSLEGFNVAWVEEAQTLSQRSLEFLRPTIRAEGSEIWFSWNPRNAADPVDAFIRGQHPPPNAIIRKVNYDQNSLFPAELEAERAFDEQINRERYAHIWLGEYEPTAIGAIWDRATLHAHRRSEAPDLTRIVIGVDPATTDTESSNYHGIVVCAHGADGRGYVLDDASLRGSPKQWAERVVAMFDRHDADAVVVETNQGGDMVKHTLRTVRPTLPVVEVRASRGKHVRAEPIASLYSLGRVSHVGTFNELEDQMCQMTAAGFEGEGSPDRVDALVWSFTELFPILTRRATKKVSIPPRGEGAWMG